MSKRDKKCDSIGAASSSFSRLERDHVKESLRQLLGMLEPIIGATGNSANLHGLSLIHI